jgi:release factor glutamine methyltransferase
MDVRSALKKGITQLRNASVASPALAAELLLLHVMERERSWLYAHPEDNLSAEQLELYLSLIARRASGEPTQHLTGEQEFWGLTFEVTPNVLIPRPETEHLIEVSLDRLALKQLRAGRRQNTTGIGIWIADVGTGSGCIAVALAKELAHAEIFATDISSDALAVARRNAEKHGVAERIHFVETSLLDALPRSAIPTHHASPHFDLIVSNPPYISRRDAPTLMREVRDHEPGLALYGGEEGYELYAPLIAQSAKLMNAGGILVLEIGFDSLPAVQPLLGAPAWTNFGVTNDLAGIPRVVAAEKA